MYPTSFTTPILNPGKNISPIVGGTANTVYNTTSNVTQILEWEATSTHQNPYIVSYEENNDFCPPHKFKMKGGQAVCTKCGITI